MKTFLKFIILILHLIALPSTFSLVSGQTVITSNPISMENKLSFFKIPLKIDLKDLEKNANKFTPSTLYLDSIPNEKTLSFNLYRTGSIEFKTINKGQTKWNLTSKIPCKITGTLNYGLRSIGIPLSDSRPFEMKAFVTLEHKLIWRNWKIETESTIQKIEWIENPILKFGSKNIRITTLVEQGLSRYETEITTLIDSTLSKSLDLTPYLNDITNSLITPINVNESYNTWVLLEPNSFSVDNVKLNSSSLLGTIYFSGFIHTKVSTNTPKAFEFTDEIFNRSFPSNTSLGFNTQILLMATFEDTNQVLQKSMRNYTIGEGVKKITIKDICLFEEGDKVRIEIDFTGKLKGNISIFGTPKWNKENNEIYLDELAYDLRSDHWLTKSAAWIGKGTLLRTLQDACRFPLNEQLFEIRKKMDDMLSSFHPQSGIEIQGNINNLNINSVHMTSLGFEGIVECTGNVQMFIKEL